MNVDAWCKNLACAIEPLAYGDPNMVDLDSVLTRILQVRDVDVD